MNRYLWLVVGFVVLLGFLAVGLSLDPREVPLPLVGKPARAFELPQFHDGAKTFGVKDMQGKVWLLKVWASCCVSCREEHPLLVELARARVAPIVGLDYKDQREDALKWLQQHGDPYTLSVVDAEGRVGIDYGVYGVPETYVIEKAGVIRHKHIAPLTQDALRDKILPLVKELNG